jgi:hypothetical protein
MTATATDARHAMKDPFTALDAAKDPFSAPGAVKESFIARPSSHDPAGEVG